MSVQKYDDVLFQFLSAGENPDTGRGTVIVRGSQMVIQVESPGDTPWVIVGNKKGDFYQGRHEGQSDDEPVFAKWTRLDDMWIGTWLEGRTDYLFTFQLSTGE